MTDRGDRRRLAGIVLSVAIVATAAILAMQGGGGDAPEAVDTAARPAAEADLLSLASSLGHPLYWAGPRPGTAMEVSQEANGSVYLRYLDGGAEIADPGLYLTVGTYPVADAQGALRRTAAKSGSSLGRVAGGGITLVNPTEPRSVYLAYPGSDLQLEVFDPAPRAALALIRSGAIVPAGGGTP